MFLYRFVRRRRRRRPRPQTFCSRDNFRTTFRDFFRFWQDQWPWRTDYLMRFWSIFVLTSTLKFQGQLYNLLYLSQKCPDCHETISKLIDWTQWLKCDHRVWSLPWLWPWIFKVNFWNSHISAVGETINFEQKGCESVIHDYDCNQGEDLSDGDRGDFRCRRAVDSSSLINVVASIPVHVYFSICEKILAEKHVSRCQHRSPKINFVLKCNANYWKSWWIGFSSDSNSFSVIFLQLISITALWNIK